MDTIHVDGGVVASGLISAAIGLLAWIVRVAARQALEGFRTSLEAHAHAIDSLATEVKEMRHEVTALKERLVRVETRQL